MGRTDAEADAPMTRRANSLEKTLMLGKMEGRSGQQRWDGWMASPTQWTWVWGNSGRWWRTRKPGVLQSMGSQRISGTERLNKLRQDKPEESPPERHFLGWSLTVPRVTVPPRGLLEIGLLETISLHGVAKSQTWLSEFHSLSLKDIQVFTRFVCVVTNSTLQNFN